VQRRAAIPLGLVWLLTVLGTWLLTTASLALLNSVRTGHAGVADLIGESALSAALACVVVGGPATAVALHVRQRHGLGPAGLTGIGVAALILLFIWSYMAASGIALRDTWSAVTPTLVVTAVQLAVAFVLRGRRPEAASPEPAEAGAPEPAEAATPESGAADPADPADLRRMLTDWRTGCRTAGC
jgi:hypothetical protein